MICGCSGPDTWNILEPLRSISFETPEDVVPSKWTMRIYRSKEALQDMPKLSWLEYVGQEIVPALDFRNAEDFQQVHSFSVELCSEIDLVSRISALY